MPEQIDTPEETLDQTLIAVKVPKWLKQIASQIGELTGEDIGQVIERACGEQLRREHAEHMAEFTRRLATQPDTGESGA